MLEILMDMLIIGSFFFFFFRNESRDLYAILPIFRCNTDISAIYHRYCPIFFDFSLNRSSIPNIMSRSIDIRNIEDISPIYCDI